MTSINYNLVRKLEKAFNKVFERKKLDIIKWKDDDDDVLYTVLNL